MKKLIFVLLLSAMIVVALSSCGKGSTSEQGTDDNSTNSSTDAETEYDVWPVFDPIECEEHHRDYHIIPYHLVKHIGIDESNEWAVNVKKDLSELSDDVKCACPDFNVKKYIDDFKVTREDFVSYGELVAFGTYETSVLFDKSPEEVAEYYVFSDALIDLTIKSQHFAFIEKYFQYEYTSELYDMIVYDNTAGVGVSPSIPRLVNALEISREELEDVIKKSSDKNIEIYGRSFNFDYDLDMLYNKDGTLKDLPTYEDLNEYETEMKLDRVFCNRDT